MLSIQNKNKRTKGFILDKLIFCSLKYSCCLLYSISNQLTKHDYFLVKTTFDLPSKVRLSSTL